MTDEQKEIISKLQKKIIRPQQISQKQTFTIDSSFRLKLTEECFHNDNCKKINDLKCTQLKPTTQSNGSQTYNMAIIEQTEWRGLMPNWENNYPQNNSSIIITQYRECGETIKIIIRSSGPSISKQSGYSWSK